MIERRKTFVGKFEKKMMIKDHFLFAIFNTEYICMFSHLDCKMSVAVFY